MAPAKDKAPWTRSAVLFLITAVSFTRVFFHADSPNVQGRRITVGGFVCPFWVFVLLVQWRDSRRPSSIARMNYRPKLDETLLAGTIYGLVPDADYWVQQIFTDYYGTQFVQGEYLRFRQRHFLPYHGGSNSRLLQKSPKTGG